MVCGITMMAVKHSSRLPRKVEESILGMFKIQHSQSHPEVIIPVLSRMLD